MLLSTALFLATPALQPVPAARPYGPQDGRRENVVAEDAQDRFEDGSGQDREDETGARRFFTGMAPAAGQTLIPLTQALGMGPSAFGPGLSGIPGQGGGLLGGQISSLTVLVNGMVAPAAQVGPGLSLPTTPGWTNIALNVPGFTQKELAIIGNPGLPLSAGERPLLVVCHRFSVSHADVFNTQFLEEAYARGWFVVSPLSRNTKGAPDINYGSEESQLFTAEAMRFMLDNYPIDKTRIYGVGFSMGASQLTSYAARHMDPMRGMFAAIVNHTGSIDQADTWRIETNQDVRNEIEAIFGGTPAVAPFAYRNASILELDEITGELKVDGVNQAVNLAATPTQLWWAQSDPNQYLVNQTEQHEGLLSALQAPVVEAFPMMVGGHEWDLLVYSDVCDWLDQYQLTIPNEGTFLADRDERWLYFDLTGVVPGTLASVTYTMDLQNDLIELRDTENVDQIETDLKRWNGGATISLPLTVKLDAEDVGDTVVLEGITSFPLAVTRDGMPQATGWSYDSLSFELTITELETGPHAWEFLP